jgi:toxin ParE1/3/4
VAAVRRSGKAESDLRAILQKLEQANPVVADRYAEESEQKSRALTSFPELGRLRPEVAPGLHSTLVRPYVAFSRIQADEVQILRILHGKQNLWTIMKDEVRE